MKFHAAPLYVMGRVMTVSLKASITILQKKKKKKLDSCFQVNFVGILLFFYPPIPPQSTYSYVSCAVNCLLEKATSVFA